MRQGRSGHAAPRDATEGEAVVESQQGVYASRGVCRAAFTAMRGLTSGALTEGNQASRGMQSG